MTEHKIVSLIRKVAQPGPDGTFVIDAAGAQLIEHGLLKFADDQSLPDAVLGVFGMISGFHRHAKSPQAAQVLLELLVRNRPRLTALAGAGQSQRLQAAFDGLSALTGEAKAKTAPMHGDDAPKGAIKASSFNNPGQQGPPGRRRR